MRRESTVLAAALLVLVPSAGFGATVFRAFGDSVTLGIGDESGQGGYPPRLQKILRRTDFPAAEVTNHGVGGEPTSSGVSRIGSVISLGGDYMLIMEGTNDIRVGLSLETTLFNLAEMARKSQNGGLTPVYATIIPRIPTAQKDPENIKTWKIVVGQRDLAWEETRDLVDNFEVFDNTPNSFERLYSKDPEDVTGHPNATLAHLHAQGPHLTSLEVHAGETVAVVAKLQLVTLATLMQDYAK